MHALIQEILDEHLPLHYLRGFRNLAVKGLETVPSLMKLILYSSEDRIMHVDKYVITSCSSSVTETKRSSA